MTHGAQLVTPALLLSLALFVIGVVGVFLRRNVITVFMCVELMLNAVNLAFVAFSRSRGTLDGQVLVFFVLTVAAAEAVRAQYHLPPRASPYMPYQPWIGFDWIDVAGLRVPIALLLDPLTSVMTLVVTGVGSLIHVYSLGYMAHDEDRVRYFSYLNLFTFFMLLLVMGSSLLLMFIGWEGVGLCSYLLIGFWYRKQSAADAGKTAASVN